MEECAVRCGFLPRQPRRDQRVGDGEAEQRDEPRRTQRPREAWVSVFFSPTYTVYHAADGDGPQSPSEPGAGNSNGRCERAPLRKPLRVDAHHGCEDEGRPNPEENPLREHELVVFFAHWSVLRRLHQPTRRKHQREDETDRPGDEHGVRAVRVERAPDEDALGSVIPHHPTPRKRINVCVPPIQLIASDE